MRKEIDHALGRKNAPETCDFLWALHGDCHFRKTNSQPNAAFWVRAFADHCVKFGYIEAEQMALKRLDWLHSKAAVAR